MQYFSIGALILKVIVIVTIIVIIEVIFLFLELYNNNNNIFFNVLNVVLLLKLNFKKNTIFGLPSWILTHYIDLWFIYLLFSKQFLSYNGCSRSIFRSNGQILEIYESLLILQKDHLVRDIFKIKGWIPIHLVTQIWKQEATNFGNDLITKH